MLETIKPQLRGSNANHRLTFGSLCGTLSVRMTRGECILTPNAHLLSIWYQSPGRSQFPFRRKLSIGLIEDVDSLKESTGVVRNSLPKRTGTHPISIRYQEHSLNTVPLGYLCPKNLNPKHIT